MGMLVTATLLDSFDWMQAAPSSWKTRAEQDFLDCVNRAKRFRPTKEQQRGMDFEKLICDNCHKSNKDFEFTIYSYYAAQKATKAVAENAVAIALEMKESIGDGRFQEKLTMDVHREAKGETWTLFGYADVFMPNQGMLDIKTCTSFKTERKYLDKNQHHVYRMCSGLTGFYYLVVAFDNTPYPQTLNIINASGSLDDSRTKVLESIDRMADWLKRNNLWNNYITNFCRGRV